MPCGSFGAVVDLFIVVKFHELLEKKMRNTTPSANKFNWNAGNGPVFIVKFDTEIVFRVCILSRIVQEKW